MYKSMVGNICPTAFHDMCILGAVLYKHLKSHSVYAIHLSLELPLVLSLKLVTSQNTTYSQAPCHNTGSHAFQVHSMSIVHRRLKHMPRTAHLTLSWRSLSVNYPAH